MLCKLWCAHDYLFRSFQHGCVDEIEDEWHLSCGLLVSILLSLDFFNFKLWSVCPFTCTKTAVGMKEALFVLFIYI